MAHKFTDVERSDFLTKLDAAVEVELDSFEQKFVQDNVAAGRKTFSEKQGAFVDKLISKYRDTLKW